MNFIQNQGVINISVWTKWCKRSWVNQSIENYKEHFLRSLDSLTTWTVFTAWKVAMIQWSKHLKGHAFRSWLGRWRKAVASSFLVIQTNPRKTKPNVNIASLKIPNVLSLALLCQVTVNAYPLGQGVRHQQLRIKMVRALRWAMAGPQQCQH